MGNARWPNIRVWTLAFVGINWVAMCNDIVAILSLRGEQANPVRTIAEFSGEYSFVNGDPEAQDPSAESGAN